MKVIYRHKLRKKNINQSLRLSYREDYFYAIKDYPKHTRVYKKVIYVIRTFGKH